MTVALIDYGAGNLRSAAKALEAAGATGVTVTADPAVVSRAGRILLPGVGAFGACASALRAIPGMEEALHRSVREAGVPFLGICVGMQLMATEGEEFGRHAGLGWIRGTVRRMQPGGLKVPQIGWNEVLPESGALPESGTLVRRGFAYFVHSYAMQPDNIADIAARCDYGGPVVAAVQRANMLGVQFHPEKSQAYGIDLLARWLAWKP